MLGKDQKLGPFDGKSHKLNATVKQQARQSLDWQKKNVPISIFVLSQKKFFIELAKKVLESVLNSKTVVQSTSVFQ